jgi:hypothetical protein
VSCESHSCREKDKLTIAQSSRSQLYIPVSNKFMLHSKATYGYHRAIERMRRDAASAHTACCLRTTPHSLAAFSSDSQHDWRKGQGLPTT